MYLYYILCILGHYNWSLFSKLSQTAFFIYIPLCIFHIQGLTEHNENNHFLFLLFLIISNNCFNFLSYHFLHCNDRDNVRQTYLLCSVVHVPFLHANLGRGLNFTFTLHSNIYIGVYVNVCYVFCSYFTAKRNKKGFFSYRFNPSGHQQCLNLCVWWKVIFIGLTLPQEITSPLSLHLSAATCAALKPWINYLIFVCVMFKSLIASAGLCATVFAACECKWDLYSPQHHLIRAWIQDR